MVFMALFIPGAFPAAWIVETKSLRTGIVLGSILNSIGSIIRFLPWPLWSLESNAPLSHIILFFTPAFIGQSLASTAQLFFIAMPPKVAQNWFGPNERVLATALGAMMNQLGVAVGFILPPFVSNDQPQLVSRVLWIEASIALLISIFVIIFFRSNPPSPPSHSARLATDQKARSDLLTKQKNDQYGPKTNSSVHVQEDSHRDRSKEKIDDTVDVDVVVVSIDGDDVQEEENVTETHLGIKQLASSRADVDTSTLSLFHTVAKLFKQWDYIILLLSFGITTGAFYAISTLINEILSDLHYKDSDAGILGMTIVVSGIVGGAVYGWIGDRVPKLKVSFPSSLLD